MTVHNPSRKNNKNTHRMMVKYSIYSEQTRLETLEWLKRKISALNNRLKRYSIREKRYSQNYAFENNPKQFYRTMRGNNIEVDKIPTKETLERFWKPIFENEAKYNKKIAG